MSILILFQFWRVEGWWSYPAGGLPPLSSRITCELTLTPPEPTRTGEPYYTFQFSFFYPVCPLQSQLLDGTRSDGLLAPLGSGFLNIIHFPLLEWGASLSLPLASFLIGSPLTPASSLFLFRFPNSKFKAGQHLSNIGSPK